MVDILSVVDLGQEIITILKSAAITGQAASAGFNAGVGNTILASIFMLVWAFLVFVIVIGGTILWGWMIVDCFQRKFKKSDEKIMWLIIIIALHFIGATIYYFGLKKREEGFTLFKRKG